MARGVLQRHQADVAALATDRGLAITGHRPEGRPWQEPDGGFASVGGISPGSHRFGMFIDNVLEIEFVDWDGNVTAAR